MPDEIKKNNSDAVSSFAIKPWQGNQALGWSKFEENQPLSLAEQIAGTISEKIIQGEYSPGERIREQSISEAFHVSRGPVREALQLLAKGKLVVLEPRRGASVAQLSIAEVEEIFLIRAVLLGLAARLFTQKATDDILVEYEKAVHHIITIASQDVNPEVYLRWSYGISVYIAEHSGCPRLLEMINSSAREAYRYARMGLESCDQRQESSLNWVKALELVKLGRAEEVEAAARAIVEQTGRNAIARLK